MPPNDDDEYMEMIRTSGAFINSEFLEDVLKETLNDKEIEIIDFSYTAAVKEGNNYMGVVFKTSVTYRTGDNRTEQVRNLMIKRPPTVGPFVALKPTLDASQREVNMYNSYLPAFNKILADHFPEGAIQITPESYRCKLENTIVMENLLVSGYVIKPRREQLNYDHVVVTLRTLARFHALSVKVFDQNPDLIRKVGGELFYSATTRPFFAQLIEACFSALAEVLKEWTDCVKYSEVLREISVFLWEKLEHLVLPSRYFNVLSHGDLWTNNMLFKYHENGEIHSCKFIDFQFSRFTTPALDLFYVLFTSAQPKLITNHFFELLDIYHEALMSDIGILGINVDYPINRLYQDIRERSAYGLNTISMFLPPVLSPSGGADYEEKEGAKPQFVMLLETKDYIRTCSKLLHFMDKIGYLQDAKVYTQHIEDAVRREREGVEDSSKRTTKSNGRLRTARLKSTVWFAFEEIFDD